MIEDQFRTVGVILGVIVFALAFAPDIIKTIALMGISFLIMYAAFKGENS